MSDWLAKSELRQSENRVPPADRAEKIRHAIRMQIDGLPLIQNDTPNEGTCARSTNEFDPTIWSAFDSFLESLLKSLAREVAATCIENALTEGNHHEH